MLNPRYARSLGAAGFSTDLRRAPETQVSLCNRGENVMMRWITLLTAAIVLSGCVTTREVVYREPYSSDGYYAQAPAYEYQSDSYYSPSHSGYGDYYVGASYDSRYFDYPAYYSVFWPINRWYYDPYAYSGYYYGVTWFPRSYFGLNLSYGNHWRNHGWLSYSPYRYSWVDNYYDWRPWYDRYPNYQRHYPTPRYGDARVEASRLADLRRPITRNAYYGGNARNAPDRFQRGGPTPSYRGNRAADYGSSRDAAVRRVGAGVPRTAPSNGAFGNTTRGLPNRSGFQGTPRNQPLNPPTGTGRSRNEIERFSGQRTLPSRNTAPPSISERQMQDRRGYDLPGSRTEPTQRTPISRGIPGRGVQPVPQVREHSPATPVRNAPVYRGVESRPVIRETPSSREIAPSRPSIPNRSTAPQMRPAPSYSPAPTTRPAPVVRSAPSQRAPVSAPRPAPYESRQVESRGNSAPQRGDASEVRRVGSDRNR